MTGVRRFPEIDVLRGLLVLFVVVGHVIQQFETTVGDPCLLVKRVIYSFHMPVFVIVAGFCSGRLISAQTWHEKITYFRSRATRLLIPYFFWGGLYFLLRYFLADYARIPYDYDKVAYFFLGYNPDGAMWFVWSLFAASACVVPMGRVVLNGWICLLLGGVAAALSILLPERGFYMRGLYAIPLYVFALSLGAYWRVHLDRVASVARGRILAVVGVLAFGSSYLCHEYIGGVFPWYILTTVTAAYVLYSASSLIAEKSLGLGRLLAFLGVEAMAVYVLGEPVKVIGRILLVKLGSPLWISMPLLIVAMVVVPVVVSRIIRRWHRLVRLLVLGET